MFVIDYYAQTHNYHWSCCKANIIILAVYIYIFFVVIIVFSVQKSRDAEILVFFNGYLSLSRSEHIIGHINLWKLWNLNI